MEIFFIRFSFFFSRFASKVEGKKKKEKFKFIDTVTRKKKKKGKKDKRGNVIAWKRNPLFQDKNDIRPDDPGGMVVETFCQGLSRRSITSLERNRMFPRAGCPRVVARIVSVCLQPEPPREGWNRRAARRGRLQGWRCTARRPRG